MKKDNYIIFLFIILFFICIKYFGNDIDNITKGIDNLIVYLKEERINIDNNEIYSYSENNENKKDTPSYYKNYEFDKELYIYYTYLNDNERVVYKQIYENAISYNKTISIIKPTKKLHNNKNSLTNLISYFHFCPLPKFLFWI